MDFTLNIIIVLIAAQLLLSNNIEAYEKSVFSIKQLRKNREFYRLISSGFIHSGWMHLFVNCFAIYNFSPILVQNFGSIPTALIFLASVLGSSLVMWWRKRYFSDYQAVGASGGVSGLVMLAFYLYPEMPIGIFLIPGYLPAYIFGILFALISIGLTYVKNPQHIAHEGHLGGLLVGGLIGAFSYGFNFYSGSLLGLFWLGTVSIAIWIFIPLKKTI